MARQLGWIFFSRFVGITLEQLWGDEMRLVWGHSAKEEPKRAPRAHLLPVASSPLAVPEVSLDVDWSRSGRVKSKGKDKVRRGAVGGRIQRWPLPEKSPGGTGTWVVSVGGRAAQDILSLLIEEEKDLFSYSTPKPPAAPDRPRGSCRRKLLAFYSLFPSLLLPFSFPSLSLPLSLPISLPISLPFFFLSLSFFFFFSFLGPKGAAD